MLAYVVIFFGILSAQTATTNWISPTRVTRESSSQVEGCQLPHFPFNGRYTIPSRKNRPIVPGDAVPQFTLLIYSCYKGFDLTERISVCQENNTWNNMPECNKPCQMPKSYTVDYTCHSPAGPISCSPTLPGGSILYPSCKYGHLPFEYLNPQKCEYGSWSIPTPECSPDCGLEKQFSQSYAVNGSIVKRDTFPWHVAIFQDVGKPIPDHICGGSLVQTHLVISAAHCFYNPINNVLIDARFYKVAGGKLYRFWDSEADNQLSYVQKSEVNEIILHDDYKGDEQNQRSDFAILVLATPFKLSDYVRPVCIDLQNEEFNEIQIRPGSLGKVAGWGQTETGQLSEELRSLELPVIGTAECSREMVKYRFSRYVTTGDKLCAGYTNGSALCLGDSGGGLVFPAQDVTDKTRWYLRAVVSNGPQDDTMTTCRASTYTAFTKIFKLRNWLAEKMWRLKRPRRPSAQTPEQGQQLGPTTERHPQSNLSCVTPRNTPGFCTALSACAHVKQLIKHDPKLLSAESRRLILIYRCIGAKIPRVCCPFEDGDDDAVYREPPPSIAGHKNLRLLPSSCGYPNKPGSYGHAGYRVGLLEFPWMALISSDDENSKFRRFTCSGTVINNRYILTAAHCITDLGGRVLAGVRVGEHDISKEQDCETAFDGSYCNPPVQDIAIEKIILHRGYIGIKSGRRHYQNDIGLLRLRKPINLNADNANAVCLPTSRELQEMSLDGETPVLPGWGHVIPGLLYSLYNNTELLKINVSVVSNRKCGDFYNRSIADGVGFRQLCAGGEEGIGPCGGDAGAPLLFSDDSEDSGQYVQLGLLSAGTSRCGWKSVPSIYIRVAYYMDWILDQLEP